MQSHPLQSGIHQSKLIMVKHQVFAWMPGWVLGFIAPRQPPPLGQGLANVISMLRGKSKSEKQKPST